MKLSTMSGRPLAAVLAAAPVPAQAQETVFLCTGADGRKAYRDGPCENDRDKRSEVRLHVSPKRIR